ncbi:VTT domain-containing protein [Hoyosella rhizosphaerae]|uniref:VTT domain-containing protein n=1 Tax=Hoyosella rhizosphaerae TaxID=1755582 RepID=A0A916U8U7_9ACTN|nr:VTT domain-containing protein [Hoyosella rhizosphaerae]MBN4927640.1 VTT domain-containing protein [Hoyosella rhizosphaerae]GGC62863.1 hypothetical protein GCM10011410_14110 [Hoyosella rhizosphaerae]
MTGFGGQRIADMFDVLAGQNPMVVGAVLFALLIVQTTFLIGLLLPGDVSVLLAGTTVSGLGEWAIVVVAGVVGCLVGASLSFWLGHTVGWRIKGTAVGRWVGEARWARAERYLRGSAGGPTMMLAVFVPVLFAITPFTAGAMGVRFRKLFVWWGAGSTGWVGSYVTVGAVAGGVARNNPGVAIFVVTGVAVLAVLVAGGVRYVTRHH